MSTAIQLFSQPSEDLLMQCEAKGVVVSSLDRRLLKSEGYRSIGDTEPKVLVADCHALIKAVMRDLGIAHPPDAYDGTRFMDILREYFPTMSILDVKQAFELFVLGELEDYLPRDGKGKTIDHYQQFSARFYIALLRGYRQRQLVAKKNVSGKLGVLLLQEQSAEQDPYDARCSFLDVLKKLTMEVAEGKDPLMVLTNPAEWALRRVKMLPLVIDITPDDIAIARQRAIKNKDSAVVSSISKLLNEGVVPEDIHASAHNVACKRLVRRSARELGADEVGRRFDWLIQAYRKKQQNAKA